jgi:hypothetical protein
MEKYVKRNRIATGALAEHTLHFISIKDDDTLMIQFVFIEVDAL